MVCPAPSPRHWRVGTVPYLVAKPLTFGLAEHPFTTLVEAPPATLAELLAQGKLDIALASSVLALDSEPLTLWAEGPVIACDGPIRSVLLFLAPGVSNPGMVRHWLADPHSKTGRLLSHWLFDFSWSNPHAAAMERPASADPFDFALATGIDAVQLIGDPALAAQLQHPNWQVIDLGLAWKQCTGTPFVFAGWMMRSDFVPDPLADILHQAALQGLSQRKLLADQAAAGNPERKDFFLHYLCEDLLYRLPRQEIMDCLARLAEKELPKRNHCNQ